MNGVSRTLCGIYIIGSIFGPHGQQWQHSSQMKHAQLTVLCCCLQKIPAGTTLLVTTEIETIEPRKVWMKAHVTNGEGVTYATGRALFVAPNIGKHFSKVLSWAGVTRQQQQQQLAVASH